MEHRFSFANAMLHFAQARGPGGFIWKYALAYLLAVLLMGGLAYVLFQPLIGLFTNVLLQVAQEAMSGDDIEVVMTREISGMAGRIVFSYIGLLLLTALVWSMFEAAIQRRYVREEGFSIGIGADEFRLLLVALMWLLFNIVGYLASAIIAAILGAVIMGLGGGENFALGFSFPIVFLLAAFGWLYCTIRLAPAAGLTIRDSRLQFLNAWGASRGRFLPLFFAYVFLGIIFWIVFTVLYSGGAAATFSIFMANFGSIEQIEANPAELIFFVLQGRFIASVVGIYAVLLTINGLLAYVWAGPASLAAKTDPRGGGIAQAPDVFA